MFGLSYERCKAQVSEMIEQMRLPRRVPQYERRTLSELMAPMSKFCEMFSR